MTYEETPLTVFSETNGIYSGINTPKFTQLEYLIKLAKTSSVKPPNLGLFGEASSGKTTTVRLLAKELGYPLYTFNGALVKFDELNEQLIKLLIPSNKAESLFYTTEVGQRIFTPETTSVVFFDEAHKLDKTVQNLLLTILVDKGPLHPINSTIDTEKILFVFATTDSSKLIYPLTTRLFPIVFDQYTRQDISGIISLKFPKICLEGRLVLADCSKLVPRKAIQFSETLVALHPQKEQIVLDDVVTFVEKFLNMETNGIDSIDKRILLYLSNNKKKIQPVDEISLKYAKEALERLETKLANAPLSAKEHREYNAARFQVAILTQKISTAEYAPKSRQDISLACRLLDENDLEERLSFLEKLSMVEKTSKGILLNEKYL